MLQHRETDQPDHHADDKPSNSKERVVDANLCSPLVASTCVADKYQDTDEQRYTCRGENETLRYNTGANGPCGQTVLCCQVLGRVEDGQCGRQHGEHDEAAAKVHTTKGELCHPDSGLDFL